MKVESGPAKADSLWQIGRATLFLAFAAWFLWDGLIRYPDQNREKAHEGLADKTTFEGAVSYDQLGEDLTQPVFEQSAQKLTRGMPRKEVHDILGQPVHTRTVGSTMTDFYASEYGYATVLFENRRLDSANWRAWDHTKADIEGQFYFAIIPIVIGLFFLYRFARAVSLRVVVDDTGMAYAGRRIPFDAMVSLRNYSPRGWIDLYYERGPKQARLRLDNEKIARFDEVVEAICRAKGWRNEVKEAQQRKARETEELQADEQAAEEASRDSGQHHENRAAAKDSPPAEGASSSTEHDEKT
jgi:hypothetical protein